MELSNGYLSANVSEVTSYEIQTPSHRRSEAFSFRPTAAAVTPTNTRSTEFRAIRPGDALERLFEVVTLRAL